MAILSTAARGIGKRQQGGSVPADIAGRIAGGMGPALGRALRPRRPPDEQGRTGDYSRYENAYPGYAKGGKVKPRHRQRGGEVTESEEHHEKERKLIGELHRMEEKEKVEHRQFGGPAIPKPKLAPGSSARGMQSKIGSRQLRDTGPRYPKQAQGYVR